MKRSWIVTNTGYPPFRMGGAECTREEALYCARLIWPMAEVS